MALFNKLFTNRRNAPNKHQQDCVSEKLFAFSKDQVRVVLFRECDFRGRKLLFDSNSIKKIPIGHSKSGDPTKTKDNEKFSEISNGFGYVYTKPQADFNQLAEMVFGSVAMSFRGTYFKIHNLDSPNRLMFTQVFSSPRHSKHGRSSVSSRNFSHTIEHSNILDDSGASSTNSISEHSSEHSTTSDTLLVCRPLKSAPLDVPNANSFSMSDPSLIGDSGYYADQSYPNTHSGPASISTWESTCGTSLSSNSLYKKWLRRNSTSLTTSGHSLSSSGSVYESKSHHHRTSKLGLAVILQLTPGQEDELGQFFMEHVCLLEAMLWRARQLVEIAYIKSQTFASLMMEMANISAEYLVNLLSGSYISMNLWLLLSRGCDNYCNSISAFSDKNVAKLSSSSNCLKETKSDGFSDTNSSGLKKAESSADFNLFSFSKLLKTDWDLFSVKKHFGDETNFTAAKFVRDFCELLETIDIKDTNFFMSTLITAVLTHHLGWVNTCLPTMVGENEAVETKGPFNPLWGELSDLYGAIGHPTKMAQTIITGANRKELISKILVTLTYFIRCCDVDRRVPIRADVQGENKIAETLCCDTYSCIPKENYKKYEDHLREMMNISNGFLKNLPSFSVGKSAGKVAVKKSGLVKTQTCVSNLADLMRDDNSPQCRYPTLEENMRKSLYPNLQQDQIDSSDFGGICLTNDEINKKVTTLCRVPSSAVLCHMNKEDTFIVSEQMNQLKKVSMEKQMRSDDFLENREKRDVVFVLGDNEQLVGLKKTRDNIQPVCSKQLRPTFLDLSKKMYQVEDSGDFQDSDFIENAADKAMIKPSTSWTTLNDEEPRIENLSAENPCGAACPNKYTRSQSVPPEDRKLPDDHKSSKSKFRYSGVKFNLQQYPQILSNYMKSKNLEMSNLHFGDKNMKLDDLSSLGDTIISRYPDLDAAYEEGEALQTPSNASELEFTSDLFVAPPVPQQAKESKVELQLHSTFIKQHVPNTVVVEAMDEICDGKNMKTEKSTVGYKMKVANLPMPKSEFYKPVMEPIRYTASLMRAASSDYMPDMVLQGPIVPKQEFESKLRSDLALASQHSLIDQPIEEAVAIIANTDSWEVQLMSSHTFIIDKGSSGIRVGMSQLVANMLESFLQMWKLNVPPHFCLMHIEQTLQELCIRSKALAELLLASEFCSMEQLTSTLQLEVNDVPLLLAVASAHTPQVTQKYGLSFQ